LLVNPFRRAGRFVLLWVCVMYGARMIAAAQEPAGAPKPEEKPVPASQAPAEKDKTPHKPELPFQIELLETHIRFETNGDSRKEVHTIVKIINILGVRQFGRLSFEYNRAFQQVEIPVVRVSHANGGTSEVLPSAVTDAVNPAVEAFPAFQDVRVKAVRILGLQEGDTVEYRVITTTAKYPLAPDFWLEHTFDRSGQVLQQIYELDLPGHVQSSSREASKNVVYAGVPWTDYRNTGEAAGERSILEWKIAADRKLEPQATKDGATVPDVMVNTLAEPFGLATRIAAHIPKWSEEDKKAAESLLTIGGPQPTRALPGARLQAGYELVSSKLATVDLPVEATGFRVRSGKEILETRYGTAEEKCYVLTELARMAGFGAEMVFYGADVNERGVPRPEFQKVFVLLQDGEKSVALDPGVEVAPFGLIAAQFRGKKAMSLSLHSGGDYGYYWITLPETLSFHAKQLVNISAEIDNGGKLTAKVKYTMRGDNELLLRVAFHQTAKEKWKEVASLLALSDGFRGQITSVQASDPTETKDPFRVEYELTQEKFVDWTKKPVRIPTLLPQIGLPDPVAAGAQIELGTPLDVQTSLTLKLPNGTTVETPIGTSVARDYATYTSKYSSTQNMVTALRHIAFLKSELPADRAFDYGAFLRAVQTDQAQRFTLVGAE
jgi:Domain of Unknown Function with PDB structure (DUF3857)